MFDPFRLGIRRGNMFVMFNWLIHNIMNMQFYWLVQRAHTCSRRIPSSDMRVETPGFDSRPSKRQLETNQQELRTRD
ncbi:hypothetical protein Hanom_Chr13g01197881 [Helianthus anomalus]